MPKLLAAFFSARAFLPTRDPVRRGLRDGRAPPVGVRGHAFMSSTRASHVTRPTTIAMPRGSGWRALWMPLFLVGLAHSESVAINAADGSTAPTGDVAGVAPGEGMAPSKAKELYDGWADTYTRSVDDWGYEAPERVAQILERLCEPQGRTVKLQILDAGAGDGLTGGALRQHGFANYAARITGIDLSPRLLDIARQRAVYDELAEVDLSQPLAYEDEAFDVVNCIGVLSYLSAKSGVLREFARVSRRGSGLIAFTLRTDHAPAWAAERQALVDDGTWELVEESDPLPYLPHNPAYGTEILVVAYVYRAKASRAADDDA